VAPVPNTQSREVNLTKRVQTPEGMRYCPIVLASNGRIRPDLVLIDGRPERHPEGAYYLEWRDKGKRIRLSVGKDAQDAAARRQRKEAELNALNNGVSVLPEPGNGHTSVAAAVARFLEETELTKKPKTLAAYTTALNYFTGSCRKLYLHEIDRHDLLKFSGFLRDEKSQSPRSVYNKFETVMTFLKANGIRGLVGKNDWPRYTEEEPEMYEQAELDKLFKSLRRRRTALVRVLSDDWHERAGGHAHILVRCELRRQHGTSQSQTRPGMDSEGVQGTRDSDSHEAGEEDEDAEGEIS
jgi:integrase/recombinase XerD